MAYTAYRVRATTLSVLVLAILGIGSATTLRAQVADLAGVVGIGGSGDEDENVHRAAVVGLSAGWPVGGRLRLEGDYLFSNISKRDYNRHFLTGSVVLQGRGRTRGFFRFGAGLTRKTWPEGLGLRNHSAGVVSIGGGLTAQTSGPWFVRLEGRAYLSAGENITLVPLLSIGRTF